MAAPKIPTEATLKKYGMDRSDWLALWNAQGGVCAICGKLPASGRLNIDHKHVPKWKQMEPSERRAYVRGLVCYIDNHRLLTRGVTPQRLRNAAAYLEAHGG